LPSTVAGTGEGTLAGDASPSGRAGRSVSNGASLVGGRRLLRELGKNALVARDECLGSLRAYDVGPVATGETFRRYGIVAAVHRHTDGVNIGCSESKGHHQGVKKCVHVGIL